MWRISWVIAGIALIAFGATYSELQRMRGRFGEVSRHTFHDHRDIRETVIKSNLAAVENPIVVIGDSITEMARLPETIGDTPLVNAGIGGATVEDFEIIAPRLFQRVTPSVIVVALGTNDDTGAIARDYPALLAILKEFAPKVLAVAVTKQEGFELKNFEIESAAVDAGVPFISVKLPEGSTLPDQLHLNAAGYKKWTPDIIAAIR